MKFNVFLFSSLWLATEAKKTAVSTSGLRTHQASHLSNLSNRALQQDEFADPARCTTTGNTTFCPDFCGPGRDWSVTQNGTQTLCERPCGEDPVFDCTGESFATSRDPKLVCEGVCDWGIAAGEELIHCFSRDDNKWQCHTRDDETNLIPSEDEMSVIYVCETLPVYEPDEDNCNCYVYLGAGTKNPDDDSICKACVIIPSTDTTDGSSDLYFDCSDLVEGTCVGKDQNGCISSEDATCSQGINKIGLEGVPDQQLFFDIEVSAGDTVTCESSGGTSDVDLFLYFAGEDDADCFSGGSSSFKECTSTATTSGEVQVRLLASEAFADVDLICTCSSPTEAPTPAPSAFTRGTSSPVAAPEEESQNSLVLIIAAIGGVAVVVGAALSVYFCRRGQRPGPDKKERATPAVHGRPNSNSTPVDGHINGTSSLHDTDITTNAEEDYSHNTPPNLPRPKTPNHGYAYGAAPHQHHTRARHHPGVTTDSGEDYSHNAPPANLSHANTSGSGPRDVNAFGPENKDQCRTVLPENRIAVVEAVHVPIAEVARDYNSRSSHTSALTGSSGGTRNRPHLDP